MLRSSFDPACSLENMSCLPTELRTAGRCAWDREGERSYCCAAATGQRNFQINASGWLGSAACEPATHVLELAQPWFHPRAPSQLRCSQRGSLPALVRGPECATAAPTSPSAPQHLLGGGCAFKERDFAHFSQQSQSWWSLGKQLRPGEMSLSELF